MQIDITYDCDDVLNKLNEYVSNKVGIDMNRITQYNINKIEDLTNEEKERYIREFKEPATFLRCGWQDDIETTLYISKIPYVNFKINSGCFNKGVVLSKRQSLCNIGFQPAQLHLQIVGEAAHDKEMNKTDIIVEDNLDKIIECDAQHKILINKPWNKTDIKGINRVDSLKEANDVVLMLIKQMEIELLQK